MVDGQAQRITIYNDGAYKSAGSMSMSNLSEGMMIGNDSELNDWSMDGKLDEIRCSRYALNQVDSILLREPKSRSRPCSNSANLQGPPYFGDVSDVYGKKGKLARLQSADLRYG